MGLRRSALADAWGTWPSPAYAIVQDSQHREVDVLMLYPLDLVAVDLSDEAVVQDPIPQPFRGDPLLRLEIPEIGRDDIVVLAGKGHEKTIETAVGEMPWDEEAAARDALRAIGR